MTTDLQNRWKLLCSMLSFIYEFMAKKNKQNKSNENMEWQHGKCVPMEVNSKESWDTQAWN